MADSPSEPIERTGHRADPVAALGVLALLGGTALAFLLAVVVAATSAARPGGMSQTTLLLMVAAAPIALFAIGLIAMRWPTSMVSALIVACVLFNQNIEHVFVPMGFFKLYPQDVLLSLALLAALLRMRSAAAPRWTSSRVGKWIVVAIVFAGFQTLRGLAKGNEFNAAFGDFRRGYAYMIVYFLVLAEGSDPRRLRMLHRVFLLSAMLIVALGIYRLFMGRFFQMSWFDVFHILGHNDLVFVTFVSFYCLARIVFPAAGRRRWLWTLLFPVTVVLVVLGNFRAGWVGFALAGLVTFALLPWAKRRLLLAAVVPLIVIVAVGFYVSRNVRIGQFGETVQEEATKKIKSMIDYETDPNIIWRMHSYSTALRIWSEDVILGAGLGRRLVFHSINAAGQQTVHFNHRAHNSLLWVGYTTGIVGLVVFLCLHGTYFFGAVRSVRRAGESPEAAALLAYVAFYVAFMTAALFDVILEESPTAITMYAHMAIVYRLGRTVSQKTGTVEPISKRRS